MTAGCTAESGTCHRCVKACHRKPGWFTPGEPEKAAALLGMSPIDFFKKYLAVDWYEGAGPDGDALFVLSPAVVGGPAGAEFDANPRGRCVFLDDDERCRIHAAKPAECRDWWCGSKEPVLPTHRDVALTWLDHQEQIMELLGYKPVPEAFSVWDALLW